MTAPVSVTLSKNKAALVVAWDDLQAELPAEYLRVESPSAEVKGHGPGQAKLVSGKRAVTITGVEAVGNYAVKPVFSDGHRTGIFTWVYLRELAENYVSRWKAYEAALLAVGLGRD